MSYILKELRERSQLSQAELGGKMAVTRQTIAAWEKGQGEPAMQQYLQLARALQTPLDIVMGCSPEDESLGLLYRADNKAALSSTERTVIKRKIENYVLLEQALDIPPVMPESRHIEATQAVMPAWIERIAQETRGWLGVEDAPLGDALAVLERKGLKVLRERLAGKIIGFSAYKEEWGGVIVINTHNHEGRDVPYERQVFTALHELGHLIFHRSEYRKPQPYLGKGKDPREKVVDHFAAAVLIPAGALRADLYNYQQRWLPEPLLLDLRERYGASVRTLLARARDLNLSQHYGAHIGVLNKKYPDNYGEPPQAISNSVKKSRLEVLTYTALLHEKISESKAAEILTTSLQEVRDTLQQWLPEDESA